MTNAVVKTVLVLNESTGSGSVDVSLAKGSLIPGTDHPPVYEGDMTYEGEAIDGIEAHFSAASNVDQVAAVITLEQGTFTGIATTEPTGGASFQDVHQAINGSELTLTFSEPAVGTTTGFVKMYFHTSEGVIDPGVEVERDPT